jgi:hypothetical protein
VTQLYAARTIRKWISGMSTQSEYTIGPLTETQCTELERLADAEEWYSLEIEPLIPLSEFQEMC